MSGDALFAVSESQIDAVSISAPTPRLVHSAAVEDLGEVQSAAATDDGLFVVCGQYLSPTICAISIEELTRDAARTREFASVGATGDHPTSITVSPDHDLLVTAGKRGLLAYRALHRGAYFPAVFK